VWSSPFDFSSKTNIDMSQYVQNAEGELLRLVVMMHAVLNDITSTSVSHPQTTEAEAAEVGSLAMLLEQSRATERQHVEIVAASLKRQLERLKSAINCLSDDHETDLDAEIRFLNKTNMSLGKRMLELYDEAARMACAIEEEVLQEPVRL
jgi:hypothetical protein